MEGLKRFSVLVCHRRFGKTVLCVNVLLHEAMSCKLNNGRYAYVAPLYRQAKTVAWSYFKMYTQAIPGVKYNESELWVEFPNGARVTLYGADNPDSLRGMYLDGVVLDEVADMRPNTWTEVIRPIIADRKGWVIFIGTPKGINAFYELWMNALADESWYAAMFRASETDILDEDELRQARRTMGDNAYRQEFECDFSAAISNAFISIEDVEAAIARVPTLPQYIDAPRVMGVDPARFGDDRSCVVKRQGIAVHDVKTWRGLDLMTLAGIVGQEIDAFRPDAIFVDVGGLGAGVVDRLRQLGHKIVSCNSGSRAIKESLYTNRRAEMWANMRDWLNSGGTLPNNQALRADLVSLQYEFDARNRIKLERKEDLKARGLPSPDLGDALALTFWSHVATRIPVGGVYGQPRQRMAKTEYNVFEHVA